MHMLKHCSSITAEHDAQALLKQCPTYAPNVLTYIFSYFGNESHLKQRARNERNFLRSGGKP